MATQNITDPILLDSTGQQILTAIQDIAEAVQPTNVYVDIAATLSASEWSSATPSVYTWTNSKVTGECAVEVFFATGASNAPTPYIEYEKGVGSVIFYAPTGKPTVDLPVVIRIINAEAEIASDIDADMVATDAISGASNVQEALETVNTDISQLNSNLGKYLSSGVASDFATAWNYAQTNKITAVHISSGASDAPTNVGEWDCIQGGSGDYGWQMAMQSNVNDVYFRRRFTGSFNAWQSFALNSNLTKHYYQVASQTGSDIWEAVQKTLLLYPHFSALELGDMVTIAGGKSGTDTFVIIFTKDQNYRFSGTVQMSLNVYPFTYNNQTNTLTH